MDAKSSAYIVIDRDVTLGYETNSWIRTLLNFFLIPVLNNLPSSFRGLARKTHQSAGAVIDKATSHEALEILYKDGEPHKTRNLLQAFFYYLWFSTNNPKAVRNRLRLVTRELSKELSGRFSEAKKVRLLSIASGSARAVVDALAATKQEKSPCEVLFLDKNERAHAYSKQLVEAAGFPPNYSFRWVADTAGNFVRYYEGTAPDIIEVVGLLDYFDDEQVLKIFNAFRERLAPGGTLVTANIKENAERPFLTNLVGWHMIYREPEDFHRLAVAAGFKENDFKIMLEPLQIHFVMVAQK